MRNATPKQGESIGERFPELSKEWDVERNGSLSAFDVKPSSKKKVWWKCSKCGHEWQANIQSRTKGSGCPSCWEARRGKAQGVAPFNKSLAFLFPEITEEWNYPKNIGLDPKAIFPKSNKKVWWKCKRDHEWQATVASRTDGAGCPKCNGEKHTSFPEQALFWYLSRDSEGEVENRRKETIAGKTYEIDIFFPEVKIGIEYDGLFWHQAKQGQDKIKDEALKKIGIRLLRVKEGTINLVTENIIEYDCKTNPDTNLNWAIQSVEQMLSIHPKEIIDVRLHSTEILDQYKNIVFQNSLLAKNPDIAKEWDYSKNGNLLPEMFQYSSSHKVWWKCSKCGFVWKAIIGNRSQGHGCPNCGRETAANERQIAKNGKSFGDIHPELLPEWDVTKNGDLSPYIVNYGAHRKVWWKCSKCGFSWQASVAKRSSGRGCPLCGDRIVVTGKNDLFTLFPELQEEWDYANNEGIDPQILSKKTHKKVSWVCPKCDYHWIAEVATRTDGHGCPKCSKKRTAKKLSLPPTGKSLNDLYPELALEWNNEKNEDLAPNTVFPQSQKKVWWKCNKCGYEWQTIVASRVKGHGCPLCSGHIVSGKNDFATKKPDLLEEWNYIKNGKLDPGNFGVQSHKKVWWKCKNCGFEWEATIQNRSLGYCKCPNCLGA